MADRRRDHEPWCSYDRQKPVEGFAFARICSCALGDRRQGERRKRGERRSVLGTFRHYVAMVDTRMGKRRKQRRTGSDRRTTQEER